MGEFEAGTRIAINRFPHDTTKPSHVVTGRTAHGLLVIRPIDGSVESYLPSSAAIAFVDPGATPTWSDYEANANAAIAALFVTAAPLMNATDSDDTFCTVHEPGACFEGCEHAYTDIDPETEIGADDADELLGMLRDAYDALCPPRAGQFIERALAVWQNRMTVDEAVSNDTIPTIALTGEEA